MATARTITKLRKNAGGHGSSSSLSSSTSMMNLRIIIYVALGLILVCAMALVRMTFHISEVTSVQAVAKSLAESALNKKDMTRGGGGGVRNDIGEQEEEDMYGQRGDEEEGDDMNLPFGGGMLDIQNAGPPVLPDLPPLPQGAGSLEESVWDEKNGTYPFTGTVGCSSSSAASPTPCLVHFPLQPNETNRQCQDSCLRTLKGQKFSDMTNQNQDRSLLVQPLRLKNQQQLQTDQNAANFLILLADGHGNTGHHVAEQVVRDLPFRVLHSLEQLQSPPIRGGSGSGGGGDDAIISILTKDFLAADVEAAKTPGGGTTGIIALRLGPSLYLAQAGDSFAFVVRWNKSGTLAGTASIVTEAVRHKPADPLERQRIEAAGGQVMMPPIGFPGGTSRVVIPDPNGGMLAEALAMSRSLGDDNGKKLGLLTAEPSVVHVDLDQLRKDGGGSDCEHFLVVSSDGVLDYFPPQELANFVSNKLYQTQPPVALEQVMAQTLDMAARRWRMQMWMQMSMGGYRDDMTLVVSKL